VQGIILMGMTLQPSLPGSAALALTPALPAVSLATPMDISERLSASNNSGTESDKTESRSTVSIDPDWVAPEPEMVSDRSTSTSSSSSKSRIRPDTPSESDISAADVVKHFFFFAVDAGAD
jgi:hypothetical protein